MQASYDSSPIKAIPTEYAGILFRSKLEARWALFFDQLGIRWEYEAEGYEYEPWPGEHKAWRYLPDFWLPDFGMWCEVKGDVAGVTDDYLTMLGYVGHFLPGVNNSGNDELPRGVVLLGQVPDPRPWPLVGHTLITHRKGCALRLVSFVRGHPLVDHLYDWTFDKWPSNECEECDLPVLGASELWRSVPFPTPPEDVSRYVKQQSAAYLAARRHRFWNPK